jgi:hypothetical protein
LGLVGLVPLEVLHRSLSLSKRANRLATSVGFSRRAPPCHFYLLATRESSDDDYDDDELVM